MARSKTRIWHTAVRATPTAIVEDFCDFPLSFASTNKESRNSTISVSFDSYSVDLAKIDLVNPLHMKDASILLHVNYRAKICLFCEV